MTCQQCGADLPDSATFCHKCGTPVRALSFSYLPAGAPPWPTNAPPRSARETDAGAPPPASQDGKPSVATRRSASSILSIIALLILAPVLGAGITLGVLFANGQFASSPAPKSASALPTAQPTASGASTPASATPTTQSGLLPTPTSFHTANNTQMNLSIKYPSDWVADPLQTNSSGNSTIDFRSQQVPVALFIGRISAANSAQVTSTADVNQANIQGFVTSQSGTNLQILTNTPQHLQIGGVSWDEQDATFLINGAQFHLVSVAVKHGQTYFNIVYYSPNNAYNEATQKYFQPMLTSFQFLS